MYAFSLKQLTTRGTYKQTYHLNWSLSEHYPYFSED